jgi:hypothetical protein
MDLSREAARTKHEPRLLANDGEKVGALKTFHHEARAPVDHNSIVNLRYWNARRTGGFERCDFEN